MVLDFSVETLERNFFLLHFNHVFYLIFFEQIYFGLTYIAQRLLSEYWSQLEDMVHIFLFDLQKQFCEFKDENASVKSFPPKRS